MKTLLDQMIRGVAWDGALAAVGCAADGSSSESSEVPAFPQSLECVGEGDDEYGPDCPEVYCYAPAAGVTACLTVIEGDPAAQEAVFDALRLDTEYLFGCESGDYVSSISGPYDRATSPKTPPEAGPCCYIAWIGSCEGRPLMVAGEKRLAPVVHRDDWA